MSLDHEAIYEAYKSEAKPVVTIDDTGGAFDADGKSVTLDDTKIANARASLNATATSVKYKTDRTKNGSTTYSSIGDQLDMLYKDIESGKFGDTAKTGTWATHIKAVKDANPKPS
tara:strand:+ start:891 stop:1235 length:345 start_codon:yes stop_codon:yes gene_type:complete